MQGLYAAVRCVLAAAVVLVAVAAAPAAASTTDLSGTYEGTFERTGIVAPSPSGPDVPEEPAPSSAAAREGRVSLKCDGTRCEVSSGISQIFFEPVPITLSGGAGRAELRDEAQLGLETGCDFPEPPPNVLTVTVVGERIDLRYEDTPDLLSGTPIAQGIVSCVRSRSGERIRFTGTRVAGGTGSSSAEPSDGGGAPVGVIAAAAVVLAGAVAAGVVVVRRRPGRERRARSSEAPEVRAVHDRGRQSIRMSDGAPAE